MPERYTIIIISQSYVIVFLGNVGTQPRELCVNFVATHIRILYMKVHCNRHLLIEAWKVLYVLEIQRHL